MKYLNPLTIIFTILTMLFSIFIVILLLVEISPFELVTSLHLNIALFLSSSTLFFIIIDTIIFLIKYPLKLKKEHNIHLNDNKILDFAFIYRHLGLHTLQRRVEKNDESLLGFFCVLELLHNFCEFVEWKNTLILNPEANIWNTGEWFRKQIDCLKNGKLIMYPNIYHYIVDKKHLSKKKLAEFQKQTAKEALKMLEIPVNILNFIEKNIDSKEWV